ncbi:MAG: transcription antitermination factor NusB [Acidobacteria bacterium]|nr:transcription antitermination factor NusB [Acidobacteriota bacterium]
MPARHRSRQRAVQVLFQADIRNQAVEAAIDDFYETLYSEETDEQPLSDPFMESLAKGAERNREKLDAMITAKSENWRIERMPVVDRNILRLAIYEMTELKTPAPVVIDEAIELARQFSNDESVPFINGVLDAVNRSNK